GVEASIGYVREGVESALGQIAAQAGYLVQPFINEVAAHGERFLHLDDVVSRSGKRGDGGALAERGRTRYAVYYQATDVRDHLDREDAVSEPPTGHGVGLGEAIQ